MADDLWLPSTVRPREGSSAELWHPSADDVPTAVRQALSLGREGMADDSREIAEMRANRRVSAQLVKAGGAMTSPGPGGGSSLSFATGRPRDPFFYWRQNNLPFEIDKPDQLAQLRKFCNTPDAPVWMGDYSFKPIGEVQVGDEVIGSEWYQGEAGRWASRLVRTPVLATQRRLAPEIVRITLESGRVIRCTPDHEWANPHFSPGHTAPTWHNGWTQPEYRTARVGGALRHVIDPTPELSNEKDRLMAAWLGGLYDGEGTGERIAQSEEHNPAVCRRIEETLDHLGLPWTRSGFTYRIAIAGTRGRRGGRQHVVNLLNWGGVTRRRTNALDKALLTTNFGSRDRVASIESEGPGWVVSMQTGTGNYTAWGFASSNCRLLYMTHPVIASCIDIYTKYPLQGMELTCKDDALTDFYSTLFFDQLHYDTKFLKSLGREYWMVGEAWPFGQFNETLGVWENEELLNPDDIDVMQSPFFHEPRFLMRLPEHLRRILETHQPAWEFELLIRTMPQLQHFLGPEARLPVSNILLRQVKFDADVFNPRGIPILLRGLRAIIQEEMLNAAQDAVADRLSTPLILARLGASATDLGTKQPWMPTQGDLANFEEALDMALAADFRVLTHHFALQLDSVFGKEVMPDFGDDFERLLERQLQVFGLSKTMISGAGSGETYAADALNRDLISQLLTDYQQMIKEHYRQRALVVAEAQGHYDYEERGGKRYPVMEEVLEIDEETGEQRIVEQPKLLIPDLHIRAMNLQDEQSMRQLIEALRASGVPISQKTRLLNLPIDLEEEAEKVIDEQVEQAVNEQVVRQKTYLRLRDEGKPIPQDLKDDFEPRAQIGEDGESATAHDQPIPTLGTTEPTTDVAFVPDPTETQGMENGQANGSEAPVAPAVPLYDPSRRRPVESDEMRRAMPKPAMYVDHNGYERETDLPISVGPRTVGMRRFAKLDKDKALEEQLAEKQAHEARVALSRRNEQLALPVGDDSRDTKE